MNQPFPPPYIQYHVRTGFMKVVRDAGDDFDVFSAQPMLGRPFPALVLMHDWMGLDAQTRLLTDQLAQAGFVVMAPDLFEGQTANTPQEAQTLMKTFSERRADQRLHDAMEVLSKHPATHQIGVVGVGLGGTFALKAAATGMSVGAVVSCSGFPQRWLGKLGDATSPIMALFGESDPLIPDDVIDSLRAELRPPHAVVALSGLGHDLWPDDPTPAQSESSQLALRHIAHFLHTALDG